MLFESLYNSIFFTRSTHNKNSTFYIYRDFKNSGGELTLIIPKKFKPDADFPVDFFSSDNHKLHECPKWFIRLYKKACTLYYEKNRLRFKTLKGKRNLKSMIWYFSLDTGVDFYRLFTENPNPYKIPVKYEKKLEKLTSFLENEGYRVTVKKENEEYYTVYII